MSLAAVDTRSYKGRVNKKSFPLRLAPAQIERLAQVAAKMQVSKTSIIEAAIDVRLDLLEGYVKLDTAPPKTAASVKRQVAALKAARLKPGEMTYAHGIVDTAVVVGRLKAEAQGKTKAPARSVRGYAIDGTPIYR